MDYTRVMLVFQFLVLPRKCKDRFEEPFEVSAQDECKLKATYNINSELPLFFECEFCHGYNLKPLGYTQSPAAKLDSDCWLHI